MESLSPCAQAVAGLVGLSSHSASSPNDLDPTSTSLAFASSSSSSTAAADVSPLLLLIGSLGREEPQLRAAAGALLDAICAQRGQSPATLALGSCSAQAVRSHVAILSLDSSTASEHTPPPPPPPQPPQPPPPLRSAALLFVALRCRRVTTRDSRVGGRHV